MKHVIPASDIAKNIKLACRMTGIQIGDVETESGLSVGYLSRIANESKKSINLQTVIQASRLTGFTMEEIVYGKFRKENGWFISAYESVPKE